MKPLVSPSRAIALVAFALLITLHSVAHSAAVADSVRAASLRARLGVVCDDPSGARFVMSAESLATGIRVTLLELEAPFRRWPGRLGSAAVPAVRPGQLLVLVGDRQAHGRALRATVPADATWTLAVVGTPPAARRRGRDLELDLDGDGRFELVRACSSLEGLHLLVRDAATRAMLWDAYQPLDIELESSDCPED